MMTATKTAQILTHAEPEAGPTRRIPLVRAQRAAALLIGRTLMLENGRPAEITQARPFARIQGRLRQATGFTLQIQQSNHEHDRSMLLDQLPQDTALDKPEQIAQAVAQSVVNPSGGGLR